MFDFIFAAFDCSTFHAGVLRSVHLVSSVLLFVAARNLSISLVRLQARVVCSKCHVEPLRCFHLYFSICCALGRSSFPITPLFLCLPGGLHGGNDTHCFLFSVFRSQNILLRQSFAAKCLENMAF